MDNYIKGFDSLSESGFKSTDGMEWMKGIKDNFNDLEWMKGIKDNFNDLFKKLASRIR